MSQAALASIKSAGLVLLAVLALSAFAVENAKAEPCAEACRSQHNACRMAAKLLFSGVATLSCSPASHSASPPPDSAVTREAAVTLETCAIRVT